MTDVQAAVERPARKFIREAIRETYADDPGMAEYVIEAWTGPNRVVEDVLSAKISATLDALTTLTAERDELQNVELLRSTQVQELRAERDTLKRRVEELEAR